MNIIVINGTEKHGMTYRLKEMFLEDFKDKANITEYYLPKDCPDFCNGCVNCTLKGEQFCKASQYIEKIDRSLRAADLIIMTSPAYVFHTTGAMKSLLDHFAYRWMPHRPSPEMFTKRAVIITQCLGSGAKSAAKDIKHSLSWWGVSEIGIFKGALMSDIVWERLPEKRQIKLTRGIKKLSKKFADIDYTKPAHTKLSTKTKFLICRSLQQKLHKSDPEYVDGKYWAEQGWLEKSRPWK
ncbi:MAG: NAD(P)H-dependent oxidoreductase [Clostridiales bacterium]|nr:NAD(P)H-dependent oxidoreductase [Clostridiales bacterium]